MSDVKKGLLEIEKEEEDAFQKFFCLTWTPRPDRDRVNVILDDGLIRLTLQRDRFVKILQEILLIDRPGTDRNFFFIRESLRRYGGWYFYDRVNDVFRELVEKSDMEKIRPIDLLNESRKDLVLDRRASLFKDIVKINEDTRRFKLPWKKKEVNRSSSFIRSMERRKKSI